MGKKKTTEEVKEILAQKEFELLEEYKRNNLPILCKKDGYLYNVRLDNFQEGKTPTLWGKYNYSNFEHNINLYLTRRKINSEFLGWKVIQKSHTKRILVHFRCECGCEFNKTLDDVFSNKYILCHQCTAVRRGKNHRQGSDKIIQYVESKGFKVLDKSKDYLGNEYIEVQDGDGYYGFVKDCYLKQGKGMSRFDIRSNKKNYIKNVNIWARNNCINAECIGFSSKEFVRQGLEFVCSCGNKFTTSISSFQNGKISCEECSKAISRYEKIFKEFLEQNNIEYIYQYSLNQCRDVLPLPFDFYLPKYNLLVEIDGEGHFRPCHFNQISHEDALKTFLITKKHDEIKNDFCLNNNMPLLRISYSQIIHGDYQKLFFSFIEA